MSLNIDVATVAGYLGIEPNELDDIAESNIKRQISAADSFLVGAIGRDFDRDDARVRELGIMVAAELYSTRGVMTAKQESSLRRIAKSFIMQLRLEGRGDS